MREVMWRSYNNWEINHWFWVIVNVQETELKLKDQWFFLLHQHSFQALSVNIQNLARLHIGFMIWYQTYPDSTESQRYTQFSRLLWLIRRNSFIWIRQLIGFDLFFWDNLQTIFSNQIIIFLDYFFHRAMLKENDFRVSINRNSEFHIATYLFVLLMLQCNLLRRVDSIRIHLNLLTLKPILFD